MEFWLWHSGHSWPAVALLTETSFSKVWVQSLQRYSKIGIGLLSWEVSLHDIGSVPDAGVAHTLPSVRPLPRLNEVFAMLTLRPARWPEDLAALSQLDTSFTTERVYRVIRTAWGFELREEAVIPSLHKEYGPVTQDERLTDLPCAVIAELDGRPAGFAAAEYEAWNRRAVIRHLYVASESRRQGVGAALLRELELHARAAGARCLWLETQNINQPAIQFYRRMDFRLCGLDHSLYDPAGPGRDEVALFFVRDLE